MSDITSLIDMSKDILTHPDDDIDYLSDIFESEVFSKSEIDDINDALKIILGDERLTDSTKLDLTSSLWKINFFRKPPSPEEFLTPEWIGETANSLYPHIKNAFIEFFNPEKPYRHLVEYYPIGSGKSLLVALIKGYIASVIYYLRDAKQFFKLAPTTLLVDATVSLSLDQAYTLNIAPMLNYMDTSPKFHRVKQETQLIKHRSEDLDKIYFTTACKGGSIFRIGDLFYRTISEPSHLLGLSLVSVSLTELGFLQEKGMKPEVVMRLLNDSKGRIYSRFGNHYLARSIIDSSPNDLNNTVDRYILYECTKDPTILRLMGQKWNLQPHLFPIWEKTKETFPMFKGSASKEPKVILNNEELKNYDVNDLFNVPIDIKQLALDSPTKIMKDYCGWPSGSDAKLISNPDTIEKLFTPTLKNFYTYSHAPASQAPEGLLWDYVKKELFTYTGRGQLYEFYRYPNIERFISGDLSVKHDMASVTMSHIEKNIKGEKIYVIDFTLILLPTKEEINIDAIYHLILDMKKYGRINVKMTSFDQFQSSDIRQRLIRHDIDSIRYSVDISTEPYLSVIAAMNQDRVKMGKNLIIKNNMKSLINRKMSNGKVKIDHEQGDWLDLDNLNWENSRMGYYGKDGTDSMVASIMLSDLYGTDNSDYIWNPDNEVKKQKDPLEVVLDNIKQKYGMKVKSL